MKKLFVGTAVAAAIAGGLAVAPPAQAVTGCKVWFNTDGRAYSQCSGGSGRQRAGAGCETVGRLNIPLPTAYGNWVRAGVVSVADCGVPFGQIITRNNRRVVFWETGA